MSEIKPDFYQSECLKTASEESKASDLDLVIQGVMGMNGEAGEAIDIIKKHLYQHHPFDETEKEHLAKEIGDVLWYCATCATGINYNLSDIMENNLKKLHERYPNGFETDKSLHRKEGDV